MEVFNQQLDNLIKHLDCRLDLYYSVPQLFRVLWIYNFGCRSHTGRGDLSSLGQIQSFNGEKNYNKWSDPKCDKIKGGDGSFMSPNLDLNSR